MHVACRTLGPYPDPTNCLTLGQQHGLAKLQKEHTDGHSRSRLFPRRLWPPARFALPSQSRHNLRATQSKIPISMHLKTQTLSQVRSLDCSSYVRKLAFSDQLKLKTQKLTAWNRT